jgi:hypothetical protein
MKIYNSPSIETKQWNNVQDFADWYVENKLPLFIPVNAEVFCTDDATSICLFRSGQFQVELYLIHPTPKVPIHEHPGVEVIKMRMTESVQDSSGLIEIQDNWITAASPLKDGQAHGEGMVMEAAIKGFPLFAVQHWKDKEPSTISSAWKGKTVGPKHEALIKRFNPNALVLEGYADITKPKDYLQKLLESGDV